MNNKTTIGIVVIIIIIIISIITTNRSTDKTSLTANDATITVGAILPLSGPAAQFGEVFKSGLESGLGSDPHIKIIYEDSKGDPATATAAFHKLTAVGNLDIVISNLTKASIPLTPLAKQNQVPLLISLVAGIHATSSDNDYAYRLFWTTDQTAQLFVDRVLAKGYKHIAILQAKNEASQSNVDAILPALERAGVRVTHETFQDTDTDYRTQLQKIKSNKPQALAIMAVPAGQWSGIMTQANDIGLNSQSIDIYDELGTFLNPGTPEALGKLAEQVYTFTTPFNLGAYKPEMLERMKASKGATPGGYESFGYDSATLLKQLAESKSFDRTNITEYLKQMKSFEGISGVYNVDGSHNITTQIIGAQYMNGAFVESKI